MKIFKLKETDNVFQVKIINFLVFWRDCKNIMSSRETKR